MLVTEVLERINGNFRRGEHTMEAGFPYENDLNDNQRLLIEAFAAEHGECWLGVINLYPPHRHDSDLPVIWKWDGELVYNFGARFILPKFDAELDRLIRERDNAPYTGTSDDFARVNAICDRIHQLGGHHLFWN